MINKKLLWFCWKEKKKKDKTSCRVKFIDFTSPTLFIFNFIDMIYLFSFSPPHSSMTYSLKLLDISGNQFGELPLEAIKNIHTLSRLEAHRYGGSCVKLTVVTLAVVVAIVCRIFLPLNLFHFSRMYSIIAILSYSFCGCACFRLRVCTMSCMCVYVSMCHS